MESGEKRRGQGAVLAAGAVIMGARGLVKRPRRRRARWVRILARADRGDHGVASPGQKFGFVI